MTIEHTPTPDEARLVLNIWSREGNSIPLDRGDIAELLPEHLEHVTGLCEQGYVEGEILGDTFRGWWNIERGPSPDKIAHDALVKALAQWDVFAKNNYTDQDIPWLAETRDALRLAKGSQS